MAELSVEAVVFDTDVASRSFRGRLPQRLAARSAGTQPVLALVTVSELVQWTRLRHWGRRNIAVLEDWLADKPVIAGGKARQSGAVCQLRHDRVRRPRMA